MQMNEVLRICVSAERLLIRGYCHGYKDMLVGEVAWLLLGPPLFCIKKPTTNLQMTCFTNESRIALGQGISFSAASARDARGPRPLLQALLVLTWNHAGCSDLAI